MDLLGCGVEWRGMLEFKVGMGKINKRVSRCSGRGADRLEKTGLCLKEKLFVYACVSSAALCVSLCVHCVCLKKQRAGVKREAISFQIGPASLKIFTS